MILRGPLSFRETFMKDFITGFGECCRHGFLGSEYSVMLVAMSRVLLWKQSRLPKYRRERAFENMDPHIYERLMFARPYH